MALTLTEVLRGQSDEVLAALLRARPDLIVPVPGDIPSLAARAQSRSSVTRAIDQLDQFHLEILDALRLTRGPDGFTSLAAVLAVTAAVPAGAGAEAVRNAVRLLRAHVLAYGEDQALQVVPTVDEVLGPYPGGLGRPGAELGGADVVGDPARLRRTLLSAPPAARAVLERLAAGPPVGTTSDPGSWSGSQASALGTRSGSQASPLGTRSGSQASPLGTRSGSQASPEQNADTPVAWLVDRGLLVATSESTVELPREVGLLLRRDTGPLGALHPDPPTPGALSGAGAKARGAGGGDAGRLSRRAGGAGHGEGAAFPADAVDAAGTGQAMEVVRLTATLLEALAAEPAPLLRAGGVGVRDLRRLARAAGVTEPVAALLFETGHAAGLIGEADTSGTGTPDLRPTAMYDTWAGAPLAAQWHTLVTAWLAMTRQPGLVGQRDAKDRVIGALAPEVERTGVPALRRTVLQALATLPAGTAPTAEEALALVGWYAPRRVTGREPATRQVLAEAATLGLTGRSALTSYGRTLLAELTGPPDPDDDPLGVRAPDAPASLTRAAAQLNALLPEPVDEIVVQADLTVVVPGPPEPALAAELELVTDHESAGGASVHRVTRDSLRRGLDAGYAAEDLHTLFTRRARTAVPQALTYLIDDVARSHGGLRVGSASGYLRSDDEALVAQVYADRRLAPLGLRRLAPTVLASAVGGHGRLLAALREAGYAPVPEDASGATVLVRPRTRRAPIRARAVPHDPLPAIPRLSTPRLLGILEDIRRGDAATRAAGRAPATVRQNGVPAAGLAAVQAHTEALAVLQQAVRDKVLVWVGYLDAHGQTTSRLLRPVSIGAGYLRAEDERTDTLHTFALHRITGAALDA